MANRLRPSAKGKERPAGINRRANGHGPETARVGPASLRSGRRLLEFCGRSAAFDLLQTMR